MNQLIDWKCLLLKLPSSLTCCFSSADVFQSLPRAMPVPEVLKGSSPGGCVDVCFRQTPRSASQMAQVPALSSATVWWDDRWPPPHPSDFHFYWKLLKEDRKPLPLVCGTAEGWRLLSGCTRPGFWPQRGTFGCVNHSPVERLSSSSRLSPAWWHQASPSEGLLPSVYTHSRLSCRSAWNARSSFSLRTVFGVFGVEEDEESWTGISVRITGIFLQSWQPLFSIFLFTGTLLHKLSALEYFWHGQWSPARSYGSLPRSWNLHFTEKSGFL